MVTSGEGSGRRRRGVGLLLAAALGVGCVAIGSAGGVSATDEPAPRRDKTPPTVTIGYPDEYQSYNPVVIRGKASDNRGVSKVRLLLKRGDNNKYFNGTGWQNEEIWIRADLARPGARSTKWSRKFTLPDVYMYLDVRATDAAGNVSTTQRTSFDMMDPPDLELHDIATNPVALTQGGTGFANISVWNVGEAAYIGRFSVSLDVPTSLTITSAADSDDWTCTIEDHFASCVTDVDVPGGGATPSLTLNLAVAEDATGPANLFSVIVARRQVGEANNSLSHDVDIL